MVDEKRWWRNPYKFVLVVASLLILTALLICGIWTYVPCQQKKRDMWLHKMRMKENRPEATVEDFFGL